MPNRISERVFGCFLFVYVVSWFVLLFHSPYTHSSFHKATYGAEITGNDYYGYSYFLRTDKTKPEYEKVTRQQFEDVDRATTNGAIIGFGGMLGLFALVLAAEKLKIIEVEKKGWMRRL